MSPQHKTQPQNKSLIFVFGEMGCGKNYISQLIEQKMNYNFYDGDNALPWINKKFGFLSKDGVHTFIIQHLIPYIEDKLHTHTSVIISYSLYFHTHRKLLAEHFYDAATVTFIYVNTPTTQQEEQLATRSFANIWLYYAKQTKPSFESTLNSDTHVFNNTTNPTKLRHETDKLITFLTMHKPLHLIDHTQFITF